MSLSDLETELSLINPVEIVTIVQEYISDCFVITWDKKEYEFNYTELKDALLHLNIHTINCIRLFTIDASYQDHFKTIVQINGAVKCVGNMERMFNEAESLVQLNGSWDTGQVTDMSFMFNNCRKLVDINSGTWDTSNVTNMKGMFYNSLCFNQPLPWNTSNVTSMKYLFFNAKNFDQNLYWNTSKVTDMSCMFYNTQSFNKPLYWDTSNVTNMSNMFFNAESFNQQLNWKTSKVTNMCYLFYNAKSFKQKLEWDMSEVKNKKFIFYNGKM